MCIIQNCKSVKCKKVSFDDKVWSTINGSEREGERVSVQRS